MTIVIFGGAGDLTHRKLLPALYNLHVDGLLPPRIAIVGVGRKEMADEAYREFARQGVTQFSRRPIDTAAWQMFAASLFFSAADIDRESGLAPLGARLDIIEHERPLTGDRLYYLALPSSLFVPTVKRLHAARFVARGGGPAARVIVEKPIGNDLDSARAINDAIAEVFDEPQIYRIDHYLGKETVQNILVMRSKKPGPHVEIAPVQMDFHYGAQFGGSSPEAYERLLLDVMAGDPTLFMRRDAVETAWRWVMPVLDRWATQTDSLPIYPIGSCGPADADRLIESTGRQWRAL